MKHSSESLARKIRLHGLEMTNLGNSPHIGSILSVSDIIAVLYGGLMNVDPSDPGFEARDRFILSKGHAGASVYAALAETGFFSTSRLKKHCSNGSSLSGHVSHKNVPGVELSTGSLGHGLPVGVGMALNAKLKKNNHRVFVVMSDGECDEGSNWEAIMFAGHHKLDNLVAIIDRNKLQSIHSTELTLNLEPFLEKWQVFGWNAVEIDGHDHDALREAIDREAVESKPRCVIAHTVKGKGVSFMENSVLWHYRSPQGEEFEQARKELSEELDR